MDSTRRWSVPLDSDAFAAIEGEVDRFLVDHRVEEKPCFVARMVVEEIVRNLIEHTPPYATDELVDIDVAVEADRLTVTISDTRPPFDPWSAPPLDVHAPLEQRRAGGMGVHLVRSMTDELRYERHDDRNRLTAVISRG